MQLGKHVEGNETRDTESGCLVKVWECDFRPSKDVDRLKVVEGSVEELQVLFGEDYGR